jgi:Leucine-rich repeat (LRR) protein
MSFKSILQSLALCALISSPALATKDWAYFEDHYYSRQSNSFSLNFNDQAHAQDWPEFKELLQQQPHYQSHIKYLVLYGTPEQMEDVLPFCPHLTTLDLSYKGLAHLPSALCNLTNLEILGVDGNNLTHLPEAFSNLKNLSYLDIYMNPDLQLSVIKPLLSLHRLRTLSADRPLENALEFFRAYPNLVHVDEVRAIVETLPQPIAEEMLPHILSFQGNPPATIEDFQEYAKINPNPQ